MCAHNICFEQKYEKYYNYPHKKYYNFSFENYHFYSREISQYIAWTCLRNGSLKFWIHKLEVFSIILLFKLWIILLAQ